MGAPSRSTPTRWSAADFCAKVFEPLRAITERLAGVGAGGRFVPVPGVGHSIEQSNPRQVMRVTEEAWA